MFTLQTLPMPRVGLCSDVSLYVRPLGRAWYSFTESAVILNAGDGVATDTYFGLVPTAKWVRHTCLRHVELVVGVEGDVDVEAVQHQRHLESRVVAAGRHNGSSGEVTLRLPELTELAEGHVFVHVRARSDGSRFRSMAVRTNGEPGRAVRLGVSITTYNRHDYVRSNVAHLDAYVASRPDLVENLRVQIVDNGRNLELPRCSALQLRFIGNRNLGGAGGFARGLMELRDEGWATHVLFMDDDVTFEPEIVARTMALLSYATDPHLCVAGAMLREEFPHIQFEAGARIEPRAVHIFKANGTDRDLSRWRELILNDDEQPIEYAGWWYFAFPIDLTDDYPLPVFMRGDDVCFGLRYCTEHMLTVNGIGVWHQDFAYKNGPVAHFYEARNIPLLLSVSRPDSYDATTLRRRLWDRTMRFGWALKYDTATAVLDGVEAFLDGPDALIAIHGDELHESIRTRYGERVGPLSPAERAVPAWQPPRPPLPVMWRAVSVATLGGHLVPRPLRRPNRAWAAALDAEPAMATIAADEIVFRYEATGEGFVARRDDARFRALMRRLRAVNARLTKEFDTVAESWRAAYPKLVSEGFWRDQFGQEPAAPKPSDGHR